MNTINSNELPADLFNPNRLPARDEYGHVTHPDYYKIYELLNIDDEGHAAVQYIKNSGYEISYICFEYDAPEDQQDKYYEDGAPDISAWQPSKPDGENWLLLSIYDTEDGPFAAYVRKLQK